MIVYQNKPSEGFIDERFYAIRVDNDKLIIAQWYGWGWFIPGCDFDDWTHSHETFDLTILGWIDIENQLFMGVAT